MLGPEFELFEESNGVALVGDNLSLPNNCDGQEAHGDHAEDENDVDEGFLDWKPKGAPNPRHS